MSSTWSKQQSGVRAGRARRRRPARETRRGVRGRGGAGSAIVAVRNLVGFFRNHDHGVARLAVFPFFTRCARSARGAGWARHGNWNGWARGGHRYFNGRGHDGRRRIHRGLFAGAQGYYSQQCCHQGSDFHGGFLCVSVASRGQADQNVKSQVECTRDNRANETRIRKVIMSICTPTHTVEPVKKMTAGSKLFASVRWRTELLI
jgi:hypothetical protein